VTKFGGRGISRKSREDGVYCINPFYFSPLKNWVLLARICVLYDQFCINRMYQRFASRNERMYSAEERSTHINYYVPLQDDETPPFKKKCTK